ncbi:terminase large subunit domain-containing protein [Providencia stuartii]|uniref:terminase large subunit domain-containing protein n=1 Tax=Providencia stuartii TaxID=588 RepID=UPI0011213949|nr:terminase family protein [Providencia stuartii]
MSLYITVTTDLVLSLYASLENCLPWQSRWYQHRFDKFRVLHKGRQIGASDYFSLEALLDACLTGKNKTFIVPESSDDDAFMCSEFHYMARHASVNDSLLSDHKTIHLSTGATIYFISDKEDLPNDCGDIYLSEWAWFSNPEKTLDKVKIMSSVGGVIFYDTTESSSLEKDALRDAITRTNFKNLFVYSPRDSQNNIEVVPLSRVTDKGRITLYSSRDKNDKGHEIDRNQLFNGYYDVVPHIVTELGREVIDYDVLHERRLSFGDELFNELFLCQLPVKP